MLYGSQFSLTSIAFTVTPMLGCINWLHCIPQVPFIGCSPILYSIIRVMQSSSINHILVLVCIAVAVVHIRMTVCQTRWIVGCRRCCWEIRNSCSIFWWFCKSIIILVYKQLYIDHDIVLTVINHIKTCMNSNYDYTQTYHDSEQRQLAFWLPLEYDSRTDCVNLTRHFLMTVDYFVVFHAVLILFLAYPFYVLHEGTSGSCLGC